MRNVLALGVFSLLAMAAGAARADRVFLVGGTVLDGKAERRGGKVIVEGEAGTITLPADSVARIEKGETALSRFEAGYAALAPADVKGRLKLADFCRDNDMKSTERRMLLEVIAIDANNAPARARLGYVKTETGWATEAASMQAKGMVQRDGQWMGRDAADEFDRMRSQVASANRDREDAELANRRAQLAADQAAFDAERERSRALDPWRSSIYSTYTPFYGGYGGSTRRYGAVIGARGAGFGVDGCAGYGCGRHGGVRSYGGDATSLSVVKVPYRHP
jgi:hypothetical protein